MLIIAKFNKMYTMFFRFFHSYKVGIRPKVQGGTIHKYLKRCFYILIIKDGMWGFFAASLTHILPQMFILHPSLLSQIYH